MVYCPDGSCDVLDMRPGFYSRSALSLPLAINVRSDRRTGLWAAASGSLRL